MRMLSLVKGKLNERKKRQRWNDNWRSKNTHNYTTLLPINFPDNLSIHDVFMLISGYLFGFSIQKHTLKENFINKIKTLMIPIAIWTIPITLIDMIMCFPGRLNPWKFFKLWINEFIGQFWFLWAVLLCSIVVLLVNRFFKDSIFVYLVLFSLTFFIPNIIVVDELYRFMFPFFVFAYFVNKYSILNKITIKKLYIITLISFVLFVVLLAFYNIDSYIYISGHSIIHKQNKAYQLYVDFYRIVVGLSGSVFFYGLFSFLGKHINGKVSKMIAYLGSNTIGIYIISFFIVVYVLPEAVTKYHGLDYLLALSETICSIAVCLILIFGIKKVKILNMLLLGGR